MEARFDDDDHDGKHRHGKHHHHKHKHVKHDHGDCDRPVAIILGTTIGAVIGAKIGEDIDNSDRACIGHALELAGERKTIVWTNESTGVMYRLTPTRNLGGGRQLCREFKTVVSSGKKRETVTGVACRRGEGEWIFKS
jgi:surface antigen